MINLAYRTDLRDSAVLAAGLTGLDVDFIDGVIGSEMSNKSLPLGAEQVHLGSGGLGAWRSHMNAARTYVKDTVTGRLLY